MGNQLNNAAVVSIHSFIHPSIDSRSCRHFGNVREAGKQRRATKGYKQVKYKGTEEIYASSLFFRDFEFAVTANMEKLKLAGSEALEGALGLSPSGSCAEDVEMTILSNGNGKYGQIWGFVSVKESSLWKGEDLCGDVEFGR